MTVPFPFGQHEEKTLPIMWPHTILDIRVFKKLCHFLNKDSPHSSKTSFCFCFSHSHVKKKNPACNKEALISFCMNWNFKVRFHNTIYFSHYQVTGVKLVQSCSKHKDPGLCKLISIQLGSMAETALVSKGLRRPPVSSLCRKPRLLKIDT